MRSESLSWAARGAGLAAGAGFVLVLAWLVGAARDIVLLVFLAVLLGAALEPIVGAMRSRLGIGRGLSILVVYAAFFAGVVAMAVFIAPAAVVQLGSALSHLPRFLDQVREWAGGLRPEPLAEGVAALVDAAKAPFQPGQPPDPESVVGVSIVIGQVGAALITLLALVYFWLTERPRLQRYALAFLPEHRRAGARDAWNQVETRLGLWARGQLILMATIGIATGIAYTAIGLPAALLLAVVAALTEIIPIVGPIIGAIPALLVATTVSPETVVIVLGVYFLIHLVEGNVLVPLVMRNTVGLSPFLVLLSLLVGGTVGGILGAVVAVPIVAGVTVVLDRMQDRETPVPIDPAAVETPPAEELDDEDVPPPATPARARRRTRTREAAARS
jgi:predicted PurR-regulated permease PerM